MKHKRSIFIRAIKDNKRVVNREFSLTFLVGNSRLLIDFNWRLTVISTTDFLDKIHEVKTERAPKGGREDLDGSKLSLVNNYNKYMDSVDRNDLICNYMSVRKTSTWTIKVVIHFTEEAVLNVFILYNKQFSGKMLLMNYKMEAIERFLQCASATDETNTNPKIGQNFAADPTDWKKSNPLKRCMICHQQTKKETRYQGKHWSSHLGFCPDPYLINFIHYQPRSNVNIWVN